MSKDKPMFVHDNNAADFNLSEESHTITVLGASYETKITKGYKNRKKWEAHNDNNIVSYIPGTVVDIPVKEGQEVKKGELIMLLEAMKMINSILAPKDAIVKKIHVVKGQSIPKGGMMIELE